MLYEVITPPQILSYQVIDAQHFLIVFNEELDATTALDVDNYTVNGGIGNPLDVSFYNANPSSVLLEFASSFYSPADYILQYQNISDLSLVITSYSIHYTKLYDYSSWLRKGKGKMKLLKMSVNASGANSINKKDIRNFTEYFTPSSVIYTSLFQDNLSDVFV